jgi:DNA processing protein
VRPPRELAPYIRLLSIEGIGSVRAAALLARFGHPDTALSASRGELAEVEGIGGTTVDAIVAGADEKWVDEQVAALERIGASGVVLGDEEYPTALAHSADPPLVMFMRGELTPEDAVALSVVGTRSMSPYGRRATGRIVGPLAARGVTIVSGLARGVDGEAHRAALEVGGRTIAILGSGLDVIYPSEHKRLADKVARNGALISEFPCGRQPDTSTFPRRNRIIAAFGQGVLVVEAGERSGALITASIALDVGREVLAVPGNIDAAKSSGTNRLIRGGAALVRLADDVFAELGHVWGGRLRAARRAGAAPVPKLAGDEKTVWSALADDPTHVDLLSETCGLETSVVLSALLSLELRGLARQSAGKHFARTRPVEVQDAN